MAAHLAWLPSLRSVRRLADHPLVLRPADPCSLARPQPCVRWIELSHNEVKVLEGGEILFRKPCPHQEVGRTVKYIAMTHTKSI